MLPNYKEIIDLVKKGATVEAQEKIMQLRECALELQEENLKLRERVAELESQQETQNSLIWRDPIYYLANPDGEEGPYCQRCWDVDRRLVRLQDVGNDSYNCAACDKSVYGKNFDPSY